MKCSNGLPLTLVSPWWQNKSCYSLYKCNCPIPPGASPKDMRVYRGEGYDRWAADPKRPPVSKLSSQNKTHLRKYA